MLNVAVNAPTAFGENSTLTGMLCPAAIVAGRVGAINVKKLVEIAALLMVMDDDPLLVAVSDSVLLLPEFTVPKSRLDTLSDNPV